MFCCGCGSILMVSSEETQSKVMFFLRHWTWRQDLAKDVCQDGLLG